MLPLTVGFLIAGPMSGHLSDRFGTRLFATIGPIGTAIAFVLLLLMPVDFSYPYFAGVLLLSGLSQGVFAAPNRAAVMNSLPAENRGVGGAMNSTFQNSAQVFSIGIFFSLMIAGLSAVLPQAMAKGLITHGIDPTMAQGLSHLPPVSILFAAFLGYNPIQRLLGEKVLLGLSHQNYLILTGKEFFPKLISGAFSSGLHEAFIFALVACLIAAAVSSGRGKQAASPSGEEKDSPNEGVQDSASMSVLGMSCLAGSKLSEPEAGDSA